jgi:hypothetical protein
MSALVRTQRGGDDDPVHRRGDHVYLAGAQQRSVPRDQAPRDLGQVVERGRRPTPAQHPVLGQPVPGQARPHHIASARRPCATTAVHPVAALTRHLVVGRRGSPKQPGPARSA